MSSGRNFASTFLQIPPRDGHPWSWLVIPTTGVHRGLSPPSCCPCQAHPMSTRGSLLITHGRKADNLTFFISTFVKQSHIFISCRAIACAIRAACRAICDTPGIYIFQFFASQYTGFHFIHNLVRQSEYLMNQIANELKECDVSSRCEAQKA